MKKVFLLLGRGCSGKDTILSHLLSEDHKFRSSDNKEYKIKKIKQYTTRPMRDGEISGNEYEFVNDDTFYHLYENGTIFEKRCYMTFIDSDSEGKQKAVYYGSGYPEEDGIYIAIAVKENISDYVRIFGKENVHCIYVHTSEREMFSRQCAREANKQNGNYLEIYRRIFEDYKKYFEFEQCMYSYHMEKKPTSLSGASINYLSNSCRNICVAVTDLLSIIDLYM